MSVGVFGAGRLELPTLRRVVEEVAVWEWSGRHNGYYPGVLDDLSPCILTDSAIYCLGPGKSMDISGLTISGDKITAKSTITYQYPCHPRSDAASVSKLVMIYTGGNYAVYDFGEEAPPGGVDVLTRASIYPGVSLLSTVSVYFIVTGFLEPRTGTRVPYVGSGIPIGAPFIVNEGESMIYPVVESDGSVSIVEARVTGDYSKTNYPYINSDYTVFDMSYGNCLIGRLAREPSGGSGPGEWIGYKLPAKPGACDDVPVKGSADILRYVLDNIIIEWQPGDIVHPNIYVSGPKYSRLVYSSRLMGEYVGKMAFDGSYLHIIAFANTNSGVRARLIRIIVG